MQRLSQWINVHRLLTITAAAGIGAVALLAIPHASFAAPSDYFDVAGIFKNTGLSDDTPVQLTLKIVRIVLQSIGIVALVLLIYGGFTIMTAGGNAERVQTGRTVLMWTIIGLVIILSSLGIIAFLDRVLF